jgi:hypothetical protein
MKELRILNVSFQTTIEPWELNAFRGAMANKVGLGNDWFHNHNNEEGANKLHYRYPLIQYKLHQSRPVLLCIDKGVDEAHHFFVQPDWSLVINKEKHDMRIQKLVLNQFEMKIFERPQSYRIHNWLALNSENYKMYHSMIRITDKIALLERILTNNLLRFVEGIGWENDRKIEVSITDLIKVNRVSYQGLKVEAHNIDFNCNVFIPDFIGLGRGSSIGFGVVKHYR